VSRFIGTNNNNIKLKLYTPEKFDFIAYHKEAGRERLHRSRKDKDSGSNGAAITYPI